jgi:hypothetical protein
MVTLDQGTGLNPLCFLLLLLLLLLLLQALLAVVVWRAVCV